MIPLDLQGKLAVVTGVGDDRGFAWYIAKALNAAGARLVLATHPRLANVVQNILERDLDKDARLLPYGAGELKVEKVIPCDASFDTMADVDEKTRNDKRYLKHGDYSIQGMAATVGKEFGTVDIFIHAIAFSPEIKNKMIDTSRKAYLTALSISSFSLTAMLKALQPYMENRPGGASAVALSYLGGDRVVPHYGGGMSTAKAALQIDAKQLASNLGPKNIRVNIISAGPYASRAATAIGDIDEMARHAAACSPLPRKIEPEEVANTTAFLCSPLASAITGHVLYVDCGYNIMGIYPEPE
jgi:enoyl-[acyl-carrier protein] reductase I